MNATLLKRQLEETIQRLLLTSEHTTKEQLNHIINDTVERLEEIRDGLSDLIEEEN